MSGPTALLWIRLMTCELRYTSANDRTVGTIITAESEAPWRGFP